MQRSWLGCTALAPAALSADGGKGHAANLQLTAAAGGGKVHPALAVTQRADGAHLGASQRAVGQERLHRLPHAHGLRAVEDDVQERDAAAPAGGAGMDDLHGPPFGCVCAAGGMVASATKYVCLVYGTDAHKGCRAPALPLGGGAA